MLKACFGYGGVLSYILHGFTRRAVIKVFILIINKFVGGIRLFAAQPAVLLTIEQIVLYKTGNMFVFHPPVILFATIAGICCNIVRLSVLAFDMLLNMGNEGTGIRCILMNAIRGDVLVVGTYLHIISWL